jgi:hypothetical protein
MTEGVSRLAPRSGRGAGVRRLPWLAGLAAAVLLAAGTALGWWPAGHQTVAEAAAAVLPADVPEFFRTGRRDLAFHSVEPDLWTERNLPVRLRPTQTAEHFIDLELLESRKLPATRRDYEKLCRELRQDHYSVGTLPYALAEWHDRLVLAFAEHRQWPGDARVRAKALYLGGVLAHYAADAAQPLHTTIHFDGRARVNGTSPRSGIHNKMDALPGNLGLTVAELSADLKIEPPDDPFAAIVAAIDESHRLVDRVYELEAALPPAEGAAPGKPDAALREFAVERCRAAARLTATLWLSAWRISAKVKLPEWRTGGVTVPPDAPAERSVRPAALQ